MMRARLVLIVVALVAAGVRLPASWVERFYSRGVYAAVQPVVTSASNLVPFALFDLLVGFGVVLVVLSLARAVRETVRSRQPATALRPLVGLAAASAAVFLAFLLCWGLNYQRQPLVERLASNGEPATADAVVRVGEEAARRLNTLYSAARQVGFAAWRQLPARLGPAFEEIQQRLAPNLRPVPGVPKWSLFTFYFERAGISGMTDPFLLEVLVDRSMLPFERPFVTAHEWAHLAGYADEAEANFLGWVTCVNGEATSAYSGWLYMYAQAASALPREDRLRLIRVLDAGPRADLAAIARRASRRIDPALQSFSWHVYDRYLKANRVREGVASYDRALVLVLRTRFVDGWKPVIR